MSECVQYVCGFRFESDLRRVALIRKLRPQWQRGLLNGIGGKIEAGENSVDAMVREFLEETGDWTHQDDWFFFHYMAGSGFPSEDQFILRFFCSVGDLTATRTTTDETVEVCRTEDIPLRPLRIVPNLHWLIPMAQHFLKDPRMVISNSTFTARTRRAAFEPKPPQKSK